MMGGLSCEGRREGRSDTFPIFDYFLSEARCGGVRLHSVGWNEVDATVQAVDHQLRYVLLLLLL